MTEKIFYFLTFVIFKQLNANIDKMIGRVENHTKHLMEEGKKTTSNANDTHAYMIQKEREKLSIIRMFPIGIKTSIKSVENQDDGDGKKIIHT